MSQAGAPFELILQLSANNRRRKDIYTLPVADRELLDKLGYKKRLDEVDNAIITNANLLLQIVDDPEIFQNDVGDEVVGEPTVTAGSHTHESDGLYLVRTVPSVC